jgi:hypothetical protein
VSVAFDLQSPCSLVSPPIAQLFGLWKLDSRFTKCLTATYHGCSLTMDVEFEIARGLSVDVIVGLNWISAWCIAGREDADPIHYPQSLLEISSQGAMLYIYIGFFLG